MRIKKLKSLRIDASEEIPRPVSVLKPSRKQLSKVLETPGGAELHEPEQLYSPYDNHEAVNQSDVYHGVAGAGLFQNPVGENAGLEAKTRIDDGNGIETRQATELASIATRLFEVTNEAIHKTLKNLVSAKHWAEKFETDSSIHVKVLIATAQQTVDQLYMDGKHIAATKARIANDESIISFESHLITADILARITVSLDAIDLVASRFKKCVLFSNRPVSSVILNRLVASKAGLAIHQRQFEDLSRIITILRDRVRSKQIGSKSHLRKTSSRVSPIG